MEILETTGLTRKISLGEDDALMIYQALNEVVNGVQIDDDEFATRLGFDRNEMRKILSKFREFYRSWNSDDN
ncbi:MAG: hypothetical protein KDK75_19670 [Alphaproteobacteria bacterium]|nr:hypothetical protein [Alphaproteobacteria bacterium]